MSPRVQRAAMIAALTAASATASCDNGRAPVSSIAPTRSFLQALRIDAPDSIAPGASLQLHATRVYSDGTTADAAGAVWFSSDSSVLTVSSSGLAHAVAVGVARVSAASGMSAVKSVVVVPPNTYNVTGRVLEAGYGLQHVTIRVASGVGQGLTTDTDANGVYGLYGVAGDIVVRASKVGYQDLSQPLTVAGLNAQAPDISIQQLNAPTNFAGAWHMTITPASTCTMLPADVGSRAFDVTITQSGARGTVSFAAPDMFARSPHMAPAQITGATLEFALSSTQDSYYKFYSTDPLYDLMEILDGNRFLGLQGDAHITSGGSSAAGSFDGSFDLYSGKTNDYWSSTLSQRCSSPSHVVILAR